MKNPSAIDYGSNTLRKAYEQKWDVLQALYATYVASSKPTSFEIPTSSLLIKNRSLVLITNILRGLGREGCFTVASTEDKIQVENINDARFDEVYKTTETEYKKFAEQYQKLHPVVSPSLDYSNKVPSYDKNNHKIKFLGKLIPIMRDTNQEELCILLLTNKAHMKKKWSNDQLLEMLHVDYDNNEKPKSIYRAAIGINDNVAKETGIKNFLITTTKDLRVNPDFFK